MEIIYFESSLVYMNALSLPVGKQHDITPERMDIQKGLIYKIKIIAVTCMNMSRWKWMLLATSSDIYNVF